MIQKVTNFTSIMTSLLNLIITECQLMTNVGLAGFESELDNLNSYHIKRSSIPYIVCSFLMFKM